MLFIDKAEVAQKRVTADGYLVADVRVARTGIQIYAGHEVGKPDLAIVAVYRPEDEVFKNDSLATYAHRPVTLGHPRTGVSAANWRDVARGSIGGDVARDGEFVRVPMTVMDQAAIEKVNDGICEISMGYHCRLEFIDGVTPDGQAYQAIQRDLRMNHAAIVPSGRAGAQCRIGDSWAAFDAAAREPGPADPLRGRPTPTDRDSPPMKTLLIDGQTVSLDDAAFIAVSALQKQLGTAVADALAKDGQITELKGTHAKAIEAKDAEISKAAAALETKAGEMAAKDAAHATALEAKDGEIAALKAQIPDAAKLDALASARADLIAKAKGLLGDSFETAGKADVEIRRAVVEKALGEGAKTMTDAGIEGAFAVVSAGKAPADPIRTAMRDAKGLTVGDERATAFAEMRQNLEGRWQGTPAA